LFNDSTRRVPSRQGRAPYAAAVDVSHLTPAQVAAVVRQLTPTLAYLQNLTTRTDSAGWNPGDAAY